MKNGKLEVNDIVAKQRYGKVIMLKVVRLTSTTAILEDGTKLKNQIYDTNSKYHFGQFKIIGESYDTVVLYSDEQMQELIKKQEVQKKINNVLSIMKNYQYKQIDDDKMLKIYDILFNE